LRRSGLSFPESVHTVIGFPGHFKSGSRAFAEDQSTNAHRSLADPDTNQQMCSQQNAIIERLVDEPVMIKVLAPFSFRKVWSSPPTKFIKGIRIDDWLYLFSPQWNPQLAEQRSCMLA